MRLRTVLVLSLVAFSLAACGRRGGRPDPRTGLALMPRVVRTSVHRDYAHCGGRDVRGMALGNGQYRIVSCGLDVVYQCPVGRHSRWRQCDQIGTVAASGVPASYAQPAATTTTAGGTVTVISVTGSAGGQVYTTDGSAGATATATAPTATATAPAASAAPATTTAPAPTREQVETGIRAWLDSQRTAILSCTQTEAALVDVAWTAEGTPGIALGGELHTTPGEQCVVAALAGVRFNTGGSEGTLRHVIQ